MNLPISPNLPLTERQRAAIALLVIGKTHAAVAEELGVNRRTIWEWKQDPPFVAALKCEIQAIREAMQTRVLALADKALNALKRTLESGDSDSARVAAARLVLDRVLPTYDAQEERTQSSVGRIRVIRESDLERLSDMQREAEERRRTEPTANVLTREEAIEVLQMRRRQSLRG